MSERFVGIDIGAETIKVVELVRANSGLEWVGRHFAEHHKEPAKKLIEMLEAMGWDDVAAAAVAGRTSRLANLPRIPGKQAQAQGFRFLFDDQPATVVAIGSHGFSVLELRGSGAEIFRENSRCSQGTGNFLRQLVERFDLTIEDADVMSADVPDPAPLSGRCPVILKTDMTHLANAGESRRAHPGRPLRRRVRERAGPHQAGGEPRTACALIGGVSRVRSACRTASAAS